MASDPNRTAIEKELLFWPDVEYNIKPKKGKHPQAVFCFNGQERFITIPSTGSDIRGPKNMLRDMRKELLSMGAKKRTIAPVSKREQQMLEEAEHSMANGVVAKLGMNDGNVQLTIPKNSPLIDRFVDKKTGKAKANWTFEMRANPEPKGEPFFTIVKVDHRPGFKKRGVVAGFLNKPTGAFKISITPGTLPKVVTKFGPFSASPVEIYHDLGDAILFKLPAERPPVQLRGSKKMIAENEQPGVVEKAIANLDGPPLTPEAETLTDKLPHTDHHVAHPANRRSDDPTRFTMNPVTVPLSIERAVNFLNSQKDKKGSDLRFTVIEGGFLSVVAHFGKRG